MASESYSRAVDVLKEAEAVLITAGAGMGVDSGLPDFRGKEGFWRSYPPIAKLGISFFEMADPIWFERDPGLAWAFYGHRLNLYRRTEPHSGFHLLLAIAQKKPGGYFVFTSNVDGQFQKAGYDQERIEECHGSIHHLQCLNPCSQDIWDARGTLIDVDEREFQAREPLPRCPRCGALARPNVLMFGDWSWIGARSESQSKRFAGWLNEVAERGLGLAIIEIGAGTRVPTVRHLSEAAARLHEATLIRINLRDPEVSDPRHISLPAGSREGIEIIHSLYGEP